MSQQVLGEPGLAVLGTALLAYLIFVDSDSASSSKLDVTTWIDSSSDFIIPYPSGLAGTTFLISWSKE